MAFYPELKGAAKEAYDKLYRELKTKAMKELSLGPEEVIVRPMRPEDLGLSTPTYTTSMSANAWTPIVDAKTIADNRFVGIFGVYNNESAGKIVQLKITRKGSDARYWDIIPIRSFQHKTGWSDDPVTIDQNTTVTISGYSVAGGTISDFALIGLVAEKRGLLINP